MGDKEEEDAAGTANGNARRPLPLGDAPPWALLHRHCPHARWSPLTLSRALLLHRSSTEGHFVLKGGGMRHRPPQPVLHAR